MEEKEYNENKMLAFEEYKKNQILEGKCRKKFFNGSSDEHIERIKRMEDYGRHLIKDFESSNLPIRFVEFPDPRFRYRFDENDGKPIETISYSNDGKVTRIKY